MHDTAATEMCELLAVFSNTNAVLSQRTTAAVAWSITDPTEVSLLERVSPPAMRAATRVTCPAISRRL